MNRFLFCVWCCLTGYQALAQLGNASQNPASIRWFQYRTPHFQIIYPEGLDSVSNRLANTMETVYEPVSKTLGRKPRRIPLVLQTQTTVSNGFVTLTPRHTEFYITPPQDANFLGTNRWLDLLAVHEYRHVVQNEKAMTGISKGLFYLFGYNATNFLKTGIPDWFAEGDAVCTETALSPGGRGRIPEFNLLFRTQLLSRNKPFSYPKIVAGSYRDNLPDWYVLGYHLTNYARRKLGPEVWNTVLDRYYRFPFYPFSFSDKLRKISGLRTEDLYQEAAADFTQQWAAQQAVASPAPQVSTKPIRVYTDYEYPQLLPDGRIVALKSGLANIPAFVLLDGQNETKLYETGFLQNSATLSLGQTTLVWAEQHFDPRWGMRDYTVLKTLDLRTGTTRQVTRKSRYFAPTISPDGRTILTVSIDTEGKSQLVLVQASDGQVLRTFPNPQQSLYQQPRFAADGRRAIMVRQVGSQKTLTILNLETGQSQDVFPLQTQNLSQPLLYDDWVLYNAPYTGTDQIYAFHRINQKHYAVTQRPFGAYHAALSPDGRTLAFQDFTEQGHRIARLPFNPAEWTELTEIPTAPTRSFGPLVQQENNPALLTSVPNQSNVRKPYSKANLFNIYGWGPVLTSSETDLSVGIQSQNLLSTAFTSAGYTYNANERQGRWEGNFSYYGWYPVIDVSVASAGRQTVFSLDEQPPIDSLRKDYWRQNEFNVGLRMPLVLTHSKYREGLSLAVQANFIQTQGYDLPLRSRTEPGRHSLSATTVSLSYSRLLRQAKRDVQPRWGQTFSLYARNTPFGGALQGNLLALQTRLYFPGFFPHHSIRLYGGVQFQGSGDSYVFGSPMFFPRGYVYASAAKLTTGTLQYQLPLAYPDWSLGRLLYVQRIKLNAFADLGYAVTGDRTRTYQSTGVDVTFDFNVLRLRQAFELGFRGLWTRGGAFQSQFLVINIGF
ncbi:hypothetical protein [Siphonobacter sp.]|uniref:hypothetical protein n=1 Tax=Siphonobacter sp. TaxID=1869184 RepID=UPI003B3A41CB